MSEPEPPPASGDAPRRGGMSFRKYGKGPLPTRDEARRQSEVVQSAWRHFGEAGQVIAFLNTRHDALDGQPLRLAIESDEGLARVEQLLADLAGGASPAPRP
ncbi:MAG: hypothetical protein ACJ8EI_10215 [Sphingomicrobium sp.]